MSRFIQRHAEKIIGMLNGWDRIRLRGTFRWLANVDGMESYLYQAGVLLKDFKAYVLATTEEVRKATARTAEEAGRPVEYLASSATRKEDRAREIALRDGIQEGLICVLTCVEPCWSYEVGRHIEKKHLQLRGGYRKCLHHYFYYQHPVVGFMHARLQTWFPFTMHICLNGREWLARQMDAEGIGYLRRDNCFVQVANVERAQQLLDQQLRVSWTSLLNRIAQQAHPAQKTLFGRHSLDLDYYWSAEESEWASDLLFRSPADLSALYPRLIQHGMRDLGSVDVMRFLGRKTPQHGGINGRFQGEVVSDLKHRPEGMRIKHRLNRNTIKMYDKQGSVLRVETTINDARDMKVFRPKEGQPRGRRSWRPLRKGIADLHRRAQISQAANERYLESMATVEDTVSLEELARQLCQPTELDGRRVRALNPFSVDDTRLLQAVNRGEFLLNGFRNRDLRPLLFGAGDVSAEETRRRASAMTRQLRLLRAHGLIRKVPKTHRYMLTGWGQSAITALLAAQQANTAKLAQLAA
jgi:hypothetical protein